MLIKYIKARNYKTYKQLDLNLEVEDGRSIILIGGKNMCGKSTLFDAIGGALYGLDIKNESKYKSLMNYGYGANDEWKNQEIELEIMFQGHVMGQAKQYKLRRLYKLVNGVPVENVRLDFDGSTYSFGTHTPAAERALQKAAVDRIIKANLPPDLREYFLFDALQAGHLVEKEQIDQLIAQNIRSVMGFNKYMMLKEAAIKLIEKENAVRINNEQQRLEYTNLLQKIKTMEVELDDLKRKKEEALAYSVEQNELYTQLVNGQKADAALQEKMDKARHTIDSIVGDEKQYNQRIKDFMTTIETDIFIPRIAGLIQEEANEIIAKKEALSEKRKGLLSPEQINTVTQQIVDIINKEYGGNGSINVEFVAKRVKDIQAQSVSMVDEFGYLDDEDVKKLKELVTARYGNPFSLIDRDRVSLNQRLQDLTKLEDNIVAFKAQLAGDDYSLIQKYEANEELLKQYKLDIVAKEREIQQSKERLERFNLDDNAGVDERYETLKKLPALFDKLSARLLDARKNVIEQNLKEHLNKLIKELEDVVGRVEINIVNGEISFKIYHIKGNEIILDGLSAAGKQILIQVLLKELRDNGDYDPPVMIDSVMGNFDSDSRKAVIEHYFPHLATQTILFSNDLEITPTEDAYGRLRPYIAKSYVLNHNKDEQYTTIEKGYFNGYK